MTPEQKAQEYAQKYTKAIKAHGQSFESKEHEDSFKCDLDEAFLAGYAAKEEEDGWISVDGRLPEPGERVLIFGEEIGISSVICHLDNNIRWVNSFDHTEFIRFTKGITHWKPLLSLTPKPKTT